MLNFNSILIFSEDPKKLAEFYGKVFNKKPEMEMEGYTGWLVGAGFISVGPHDKVKGKSTQPERVMFNLETEQVKEEFERIKGVGATVVKEPYTMGDDYWIATFADPDRNYFQVVTPWKG